MICLVLQSPLFSSWTQVNRGCPILARSVRKGGIDVPSPWDLAVWRGHSCPRAHADLRILPINNAVQVAHIRGLHASGLDGKNDLLSFAVSLVFVVDPGKPRVPHPCAFCAQGWDRCAVSLGSSRVARALLPASALEQFLNLRPAKRHLLFRRLPRSPVPTSRGLNCEKTIFEIAHEESARVAEGVANPGSVVWLARGASRFLARRSVVKRLRLAVGAVGSIVAGCR